MIRTDIQKIGLACDHAGYEMKEAVKEFIHSWAPSVEIIDYGTYGKESVDYPDFAQKLATAIQNKEVDCGVASCGTANGITMTMNRFKGVRATIAWQEEVAQLVRMHNDANILSLPGRFLTLDEGIKITEVFLSTAFEGDRHQRRLDKIDALEGAIASPPLED